MARLGAQLMVQRGARPRSELLRHRNPSRLAPRGLQELPRDVHLSVCGAPSHPARHKAGICQAAPLAVGDADLTGKAPPAAATRSKTRILLAGTKQLQPFANGLMPRQPNRLWDFSRTFP